MANESSEVRSFGLGGVYLAPVGTSSAAIAAVNTPISSASGWVNLGFLTPEGPRPTFGREKTEVRAWQSEDPVRTLTTGVPKKIAFDLLQSNRHTVALALGGGTWSEAGGIFHFVPDDSSVLQTHALALEMIDGEFTYRFLYPKVEREGEVTFAAVRTDATKYAITMTVLAPDGGAKPFEMWSDDPNLSLLEAGS